MSEAKNLGCHRARLFGQRTCRQAGLRVTIFIAFTNVTARSSLCYSRAQGVPTHLYAQTGTVGNRTLLAVAAAQSIAVGVAVLALVREPEKQSAEPG